MRAPMIAGIGVLLTATAVIAAILFGAPQRDETGLLAAPSQVSSDSSTLATGATSISTGLSTGAAAGIDGPSMILALTANMYSRPTSTGDLVAIIPEGRIVRITGRTDDNEWLRINYPVTSGLEGWVPRTHARVDSLPDLAEVPAMASGTAGDADGLGGSVNDDEDALPDLTISSAEVQPNGTLVVRITNVGRGTFRGEVDLQVTTAEGDLLGVLDVDLTQSPLASGRSASVNTGIVIRTTGLFVIEVDRQNQVAESNDFNNTRRVLLVGVGG